MMLATGCQNWPIAGSKASEHFNWCILQQPNCHEHTNPTRDTDTNPSYISLDVFCLSLCLLSLCHSLLRKILSFIRFYALIRCKHVSVWFALWDPHDVFNPFGVRPADLAIKMLWFLCDFCMLLLLGWSGWWCGWFLGCCWMVARLL